MQHIYIYIYERISLLFIYLYPTTWITSEEKKTVGACRCSTIKIHIDLNFEQGRPWLTVIYVCMMRILMMLHQQTLTLITPGVRKILCLYYLASISKKKYCLYLIGYFLSLDSSSPRHIVFIFKIRRNPTPALHQRSR
jgi:hypothetical protein